jgi:hypothetical protein
VILSLKSRIQAEELADLEAIATFFVEGLLGHIPDWTRNRASV